MATATSAAASISASAAASSSTPFQFSSVWEANSYRLKAIVERLTFIMNSRSGSIRFDSAEFFNLCVALARGVDYALTINDTPAVVHRLPSLIKQAYQRRDESSLQPAIMILMISVKNACKNGWFTTADTDELLKMANELSRNFCMVMSVIAGVGNAQDIILVLVSRFYPQFKMGSLIASFEAKPGYEILMSDFQITRNVPQDEKIMLIVVQMDNLETSSCIISPPQVSFLVNGKGVDRRTNVSLDNGPQFPTDITKMLKFGSNIIQAIGCFSGTYLIAVAYMSKIPLSNTPILKDYAQPVVVVGADSEITEGASRITLNCPISFRRIKTPVKGHLCKHHQCFDYDNFMVMNSRKPAWRCPCCNQTVSFIDLRIDQNMVKILKEVDQDVINVVICADGSWKAGIELNRSNDQPQQENISRQQDCHEESASTRSANTSKVDIDLTIGEDGQSDSSTSPSQVGAQYESFSQRENLRCETEDTKPFKDSHDLHIRQFLSETPLTNHATMIAPFASQLLNPAMMDAVAPALSIEPLPVLESSQTNFSHQQISQVRALAENVQLQPRFENLMISHEPERLPIPRHVDTAPVAVQAFPVPAQPPSSFKRMRVNGPSSSSLNTNDSSSDTEMQPVFRTSDLSMIQDRDHETHQQVQSPASQHVVSQPAPHPISTSVASSLQRGSGAYRASLQPSSDNQASLGSASDGQGPQRNPSNLRSLIMSGSYRSNVALPLGATRELARQLAQQKQQLQTGVNPQASRAAVSIAATADGLRLSVMEPTGNIAERPLDKNWWPTGRMRGSLTGSAYSAALTHYKPPTTQTQQARPPPSTVVPSASAQLPSSPNLQGKQQ